MHPLTPSTSVKGEDKDKFMKELETARIASSLENRRQQALIRRVEWVPEAREEVAARKAFKKTMDIFPDLVWEAILERVGDPKDKAVMSNMTQMWWNLCQGDRAKFLFQNVFSILHSNGYLSKTNDMLNCRLICKEWKRSIDDYLQSSESKTDLDFLVPQPLPHLELIFPYDLESFPQVVVELHNLKLGLSTEDFVHSAQFDYSGENPFISRKLVLGTPAPLVQILSPVFWGYSEDILERWGQELWELTLCFDKGMTAGIVHQEIHDKLGFCPNLRYLRIICNEYGELSEDVHKSEYGFDMKNRRENGQYLYGELMRYVNADPLPDLPYLKSLQTTFVPPPIIQAMIKKYGSTLETLCCGAFEAKPTDYVEGRVLPNLKEFKSFYFAPDPDVEPVPLTFTAEWPNLKELTLLFDNVHGRNIPSIFESLNRFSSYDLCKLTLHLQKEDGAMAKLCNNVIGKLSLELPGLEVMTLSICRIALSSIDFLLPLVKLNELNLIYVKHVASFDAKSKDGHGSKKPPGTKTAAPRDELIKLSDYINRLYDSNIWRVFPELKLVRIGVVKICTAYAQRLVSPDKRHGGRSTEQLRLIQIRDVSGMTWDVDGTVQTKRKVYTREGYERHLKTCN